MNETKPDSSKEPSQVVKCLHCGNGINLKDEGTWKQEGNRLWVTCPTCHEKMEAISSDTHEMRLIRR